jgi:DNA polymerase bacteriophage-type
MICSGSVFDWPLFFRGLTAPVSFQGPAMIHIDFETRSSCDLRKTGPTVYARHHDTEVLCVAFAKDDGPVRIISREEILSGRGDSLKILKRYATNDFDFTAFNANFEIAIWTYTFFCQTGIPVPPIHRWSCVAARAAACALPTNLRDCAIALGTELKSEEGKSLLQKLSKPNAEGGFTEDAMLLAELEAYCVQDVIAERGLCAVIPKLSVFERAVWRVDQTINSRGFRVDIPAIEAIEDLSGTLMADYNAEIASLTDGVVSSASQVKAVRDWLEGQGIQTEDLAKPTVARLLALPDLSGEVRRVLEIRADGARLSAKKYASMKKAADPKTRRVYDAFQYCGAGRTGRWAGRRIQPQNMARGGSDSEAIIQAVHGGYTSFKLQYPQVNKALGSAVRSAILAAPGHTFVACDYSAIEARVTAWLSGEKKTIAAFREGRDIYLDSASAAFARPISKDDKAERQVGKVMELALGYQGGISAFAAMAQGYNLDLTPVAAAILPTASPTELASAERCAKLYFSRHKGVAPGEQGILTWEHALVADVLKQRWRRANPYVVEFWGQVEKSVHTAIYNPDHLIRQGELSFALYDKGRFLGVRLPSGRVLSYFRPHIKDVRPFWEEEESEIRKATAFYIGKNQSETWGPIPTYGGKLVENIVQAVSRDLLANSLFECETAGLPAVLHVHDEIVLEVKREEAERAAHQLVGIIETPPHWAGGLPLASEAWIGERYRK